MKNFEVVKEDKYYCIYKIEKELKPAFKGSKSLQVSVDKGKTFLASCETYRAAMNLFNLLAS